MAISTISEVFEFNYDQDILTYDQGSIQTFSRGGGWGGGGGAFEEICIQTTPRQDTSPSYR